MEPVVIERGAKRVFASALDWPGWSRSGRTADAALETLSSYADRYAPVARRAGLSAPDGGAFDVVEELAGGTGTDFGVPGAIAASERRPLGAAEAERVAALVESAWAELDQVVAVTPPELRKGPRGGGRDRDPMLRHVLEADIDYARKIDLVVPRLDAKRAEPVSTSAFRAMVLDVLRTARDPVPPQEHTRSAPWPYRYAARRIAWHALDHAWEMQDRTIA